MVTVVFTVTKRFTPTGVGTTREVCPSSAENAVHPHGRGDNGVFKLFLCNSIGSPPRAWGQRLVSFTASSLASVHPHGRGDNMSAFVCAGGISGSPPRAWGQLRVRTANDVPRRFTPTGVGTTIQRLSWRGKVYGSPPRAWGQRSAGVSARFGHGSPPRAWGQLLRIHYASNPRRFTPTGVGTTLKGCFASNL